MLIVVRVSTLAILLSPFTALPTYTLYTTVLFVLPDAFLSDYIDGEYLGNVVHSGTVLYILKNTSADDLSTITFHVDAPHNEDVDSIGDDVKIELNFE